MNKEIASCFYNHLIFVYWPLDARVEQMKEPIGWKASRSVITPSLLEGLDRNLQLKQANANSRLTKPWRRNDNKVRRTRLRNIKSRCIIAKSRCSVWGVHGTRSESWGFKIKKGAEPGWLSKGACRDSTGSEVWWRNKRRRCVSNVKRNIGVVPKTDRLIKISVAGARTALWLRLFLFCVMRAFGMSKGAIFKVKVVRSVDVCLSGKCILFKTATLRVRFKWCKVQNKLSFSS